MNKLAKAIRIRKYKRKYCKTCKNPWCGWRGNVTATEEDIENTVMHWLTYKCGHRGKCKRSDYSL